MKTTTIKKKTQAILLQSQGTSYLKAHSKGCNLSSIVDKVLLKPPCRAPWESRLRAPARLPLMYCWSMPICLCASEPVPLILWPASERCLQQAREHGILPVCASIRHKGLVSPRSCPSVMDSWYLRLGWDFWSQLGAGGAGVCGSHQEPAAARSDHCFALGVEMNRAHVYSVISKAATECLGAQRHYMNQWFVGEEMGTAMICWPTR